MSYHYAVESRFTGGGRIEAYCTSRTAAEVLIKGLRELRCTTWQFRIVALTKRGKSSDWE